MRSDDRPYLRRMVFLGLFLLISGCTSLVVVGDGSLIKGSPFPVSPTSPPAWEERAKENTKAIAEYNKNERTFYRNHGQRPQVCLALSGGGIRSAAFSIGVLKGLHDLTAGSSGDRLLDRIDIISGTSGGAFALSWFYMQQFSEPPEAKDRLFDFGDDYQRRLLDEASFYTAFDYGLSGLSNVVLLSPVNFVVNGLWGGHINTSLARHIYQRDIKNTFHAGKTASFPELADFIKDRNLPYFIITATARIDEDRFHYDSLLANTVFEMTPIRYGSDAFGYQTSQFPFDLATAIAVSGSAPDSTQIISGAAQKVLASGLNADYGMYIPNYNDTRSKLVQYATKFLPFPFYLFTESYSRDKFGSDIYLSDGGHQENLAAFPLIRRLCQEVIIVDGEYDPNYEFEGYFKLKHALEREMQVAVSLDKLTSVEGEPCPVTDVDQIEMALGKSDGMARDRAEVEGGRANIPRRYFSGAHPVLRGSIKSFPLFVEGAQEKQPEAVNISLTYIKLSIDEGKFAGWDNMTSAQHEAVRGQVGRFASDYFVESGKNICSTKPSFLSCAFPHFPTSHQSFTPEQFKAYVDLGSHMVERHLVFDQTKGEHGDAATNARAITLTVK